MPGKRKLLSGNKIDPKPITGSISITELVDNNLLSYNGGRLREACRLFTEKILQEDVTVGVSLSGALTPAGLGISALIPLIENGFIDWMVSTGANLYHDTHFAIGLSMHRGRFDADDVSCVFARIPSKLELRAAPPTVVRLDEVRLILDRVDAEVVVVIHVSARHDSRSGSGLARIAEFEERLFVERR